METPQNPQIENNFKHHPPTADKALLHQEVRDECKNLAYFIDVNLPNSREKSLAITKLEEVMMWANAAIARNE